MEALSWILHSSNESENFLVFDEFLYYKTVYGDILRRDDFYDVRSPFLMNSQLNKTSTRQRKKKTIPSDTVPEHFLKRSAHVEAVSKRIRELMGPKMVEFVPCANERLKQALQSVPANTSLLYSDRDLPSMRRKSLEEGETITVGTDEAVLFENTQNRTVTVCSADGRSMLCPPSSAFLIGQVNLARHLIARNEPQFDFIVMDPPWQNRSVKRKNTYAMFDNNDLREIDVGHLLHENGLLAMWVTNSHKSQKAAVEILEEWGLKLLATWHWLKITKNFDTVYQFAPHHKVPFESVFIACRPDAVGKYESIKDEFCFASVPHGFHSKKPPIHGLLQHVGASIGERALTVFLLVYTILNLINGDTWLQAAISSSSFAFVLAIVVVFFIGLHRNDSFFVVPMLALQCVIIIWCFIWIFAGMTNIVSGHLWATESLGGPKSNDEPRVTDIHSDGYIGSDQENPETVRAIKVGQLAIGFSMIGVFFTMWAFVMIKGLYEWMLKTNVDFKQKNDDSAFEHVQYRSRLSPIAV